MKKQFDYFFRAKDFGFPGSHDILLAIAKRKRTNKNIKYWIEKTKQLRVDSKKYVSQDYGFVMATFLRCRICLKEFRHPLNFYPTIPAQMIGPYLWQEIRIHIKEHFNEYKLMAFL